MKLSILLLSSLLALGVAATAQNNTTKESVNIKDTALVKKNPVKKLQPKTCKKDSAKVVEPIKPIKHSGRYCPNCGMG